MTVTVIEGRVPRWNLPDRLRKARDEAGLDAATLADMIGIHRNSVSNYETGKREPTRPVVIAWALATGVPSDWLLTGAGEQGSDGPDDGVARPEGFEPPTFCAGPSGALTSAYPRRLALVAA